MTSNRAITIGMLLALTISLVGPATAGASSLLSGYGGPGQGNQEILGSTLLNGSSSGGGGGSTGAVAAEPVAPESSTGAGSSESQGATSKVGAGKSAGRARRPGTGRHGRGERSAAQPTKTHGHASAPDLSPAADLGSQTLGVSGTDAVYVFLALAVLATTGVLTARLTRRVR